MIKPVLLYTKPILKIPCKFISNFTGVDKIGQDLLDTMEAYRGVGVAANQINLDLNIACMWLENKTKKLVLANIIIKGYTKEEEILEEGCLSSPGVFLKIKRYKGIDIEAQDILGNKVIYRFTEYDARIVQHEIAHLQGKMIIDEARWI